MSFNIRLATPADGDNAWQHRKQQVFDLIQASAPDLLGLQEALPSQRDDIANALPQYSSIGGGREANGTGEASPILYRTLRYDVLTAGMFWLSDSPEKPGSKTWGNEYPRICSWAHLFDRKTESRVCVFNTHWDHQSQPARLGAGRLIAKHIDRALQTGDPVVVLGDFNVGPKNPARTPLAKLSLREAFFDRQVHDAAVGTFHAFQGEPKGEKIDAILVSDRWIVESATINRSHRKERYPSDHFPVSVTLRLKP